MTIMKRQSENTKASPGLKKKKNGPTLPPVQSPQQPVRQSNEGTSPTSPQITTIRRHSNENMSPQRSPGNSSNIIEADGQEFFWVEYQPSREPTVLPDPEAPAAIASPAIRRRMTNMLIPPLDVEEELSVFTPERASEEVEELLRDGVCVVEGRITKRRRLELQEAKYREIAMEATMGDVPEKEFVRPSCYIRYFEKLPDEVIETVEYDMDSDDESWLSNFNKGRRGAGLFTASEDDFEKIIDRLEKETFNQQRLKLQTGVHHEEEEEVTDVVCCVCNDDYSDDTNLIVFCDGCNISVHQDCYGIVNIPEGRWLCQKCEKKARPHCVLCPNDGGAYKQTIDGKWVHVSCALWIPETGFAGTNCAGAIVGVNQICKARWKLLCYICKQKKGACVQCHERTCAAAFHVSCGQEHHLCLSMKEGKLGLDFFAYCEKHTPAGYKRTVEKKSKTQKVYKRPAANFKNLENKLRKSVISLSKAQRLIQLPSQIVEGVFEYWLHKRQKRSGLPLLRSLAALETPSANKKKKDMKKTDAEILEDLVLLRKDFEKTEFLIELMKRREKTKRDILQAKKEIFELTLNPIRSTVERLLHLLDKEDTMKLFQEPVDPAFAPNYLSIVKEPMDFSTIKKRFIGDFYKAVEIFWSDFELMCNNAILYNAPNTIYAKEAKRLLLIGERLQQLIKESGYSSVFDSEHISSIATDKPLTQKRKREQERPRSKSQERSRSKSQERPNPKEKNIEDKTSDMIKEEEEEENVEQDPPLELLYGDSRRRSERLKSDATVQEVKPKPSGKKKKLPVSPSITKNQPEKRKYTKRALKNGKNPSVKPTKKQSRLDELSELKQQLETSEEEEEEEEEEGYPTRSKRRKSELEGLTATKTKKTRAKKIAKPTKHNRKPSPLLTKASKVTPRQISKLKTRPVTNLRVKTKKKASAKTKTKAETGLATAEPKLNTSPQLKKAATTKNSSEVHKEPSTRSKRNISKSDEDEYVGVAAGALKLSSKSTLGSRKATKLAVKKKTLEDAKPAGNSRKKKRVVGNTPPPSKKLRLSTSPTRSKAAMATTTTLVVNGKRKGAYKKKKKRK